MHVIGALCGCILHTFYSFEMLLEPVLAMFLLLSTFVPFHRCVLLYTPLLVNVVPSLQGPIFMHYMPSMCPQHFFPSLHAEADKSKHKRRATATALAAFRQKAPKGGGRHDSHF